MYLPNRCSFVYLHRNILIHYESKLRKLADDEGNIPREEVTKANEALEETLAETHVIELNTLDMSRMEKIDVPARVISQILDIAEYNS